MVITDNEVLSVSEEFQFTVILMIQNWMLFLLLPISRSVVLVFETWQTQSKFLFFLLFNSIDMRVNRF